MSGKQRVMTTRIIKESVDYEALVRAMLEFASSQSLDSEAVAGAMETLSNDSRSIIEGVMKSFEGRYQDAIKLLEKRLGQYEKDLRWRKVFGFAFKSDLRKEAWEAGYREFLDVAGAIESQHARVLGSFVAAYCAMVGQAAEALTSVMGEHNPGVPFLLQPNAAAGER